MYSNPPLHGALLVTKILQDEELKQLWYKVGGSTASAVVLCGSTRQRAWVLDLLWSLML